MLRTILNSSPVLRILEVLDRRQENRLAEFGMLAQAFEFVRTNSIPGDYFEFGLWRGKTFVWARLMARRYKVTGIKFRGFDSFQGLPASSGSRYKMWEQGDYAFGRPQLEQVLRRSGFQAHEYELTEGFYSQTLTMELSAKLRSHGIKAAVVYIDCDLYESTVEVLRFIRPFLQDGSVVCFDDYFAYRGHPDMGEQRALAEFTAANPDLHMRPYLVYGSVGMSFLCHTCTPELGHRSDGDV